MKCKEFTREICAKIIVPFSCLTGNTETVTCLRLSGKQVQNRNQSIKCCLSGFWHNKIKNMGLSGGSEYFR